MNYEKKETIVKIDNVSLTLGKNLILNNLNLHIEDIYVPGRITGQIESLIGPSGIGKTQTIKLLAGLMQPTSGQVLIGQDLKQVKVGQVGLVQQNYPLFNHRTVLGNLSFANKKYTKQQAKEKAKEYLDYFGMWDKKDCYPYELSGGQKQRIAIIQQLISSDHFILMDEPFSGLDINMITKVSDTIQKIANLDELNTIIIITHDISSACAISDTVYLLGKDQNPDGSYIPGAYIKHTYDLLQRGLTYEPGIRELPAFNELTKEIRTNFKNLG